MKRILKSALVEPLVHPRVAKRLRWLTRDRAVVFMLHRFRDPELGNRGYEPQSLRFQLSYLRKEGYQLFSLPDLFRRMEEGGAPLERAVVFTVDDGYADFVTAGLPVFEEFDCPVTLFVATGFVDREYWFWWDRLNFILHATDRSRISVRWARNRLSKVTDNTFRHQREPEGTGPVRWEDPAEVYRALTPILHELGPEEKELALKELAASLAVEVPIFPPERYRALTWSELTGLQSKGVTLAPHTVHHPRLVDLRPPEVASEARGSFSRLLEKTGSGFPVLAYPYGAEEDVSEEAAAAVAGAGLKAAFAACPGYLCPSALTAQAPQGRSTSSRYWLPRFPHPDPADWGFFRRIVTGVNRLRPGPCRR